MEPLQVDFRRALLSATKTRLTPDDYKVFVTRIPSAFTPEETRGFNDVFHLFPAYAAADARNWEILKSWRRPSRESTPSTNKLKSHS